MNHESLTDRVAECVAAGGRLLDEKMPEWFKTAFDWDRFDINSASDCLLGQLNRLGGLGVRDTNDNHYWNGAIALGLAGDYDYVRRSECGFTYSGSRTAAAFKTAWQHEVNERLKDERAETGVKCNYCRLNDTVVDGVCTSCGKSAGKTITLNPTEQQLLVELLTARLADVEAERMKLKPAYRTFLNPQVMSTRALMIAVRDAS